MLTCFHVHKHTWFWLFTYRHTLVDQGSCGAFFEPIFLDNLRRLQDSPMECLVLVPNQFKHSSKPTKMTYHVSFGSRYQLDDMGTYISTILFNDAKWCARRSCRNGGFKICERPWRCHAIESPCLVTELLLRNLSLDSKILLQNPVNTV